MHAAMASGTPEAAKEFLTIALALLLALQRYLQTTKKNPHLQQGPIPSAVPHPIRTVKEVKELKDHLTFNYGNAKAKTHMKVARHYMH